VDHPSTCAPDGACHARRHLMRLMGGRWNQARADDPALNVRNSGHGAPAARVVVSRRSIIPLNSKLAQTAKDVPLLLATGPTRCMD